MSLIQAAEVIVPEFLVEIINSGMCPQDHIIMKTFNPILHKLIEIGNNFCLQILSNFFKLDEKLHIPIMSLFPDM